jgi:glycosyltransferase involved in cell wall biosynthesis
VSDPRARVVYLAHTLAVGGAEEMILNLVRYLPAEYERAVVCIDRPGPIGLEIEKTGVPFRALGLQPGLRRPLDLHRLQQFIHGWEPTIVHTFLLTASLYGRFAAMLARVPIVIGTEVNIYERKQPLHRMAERWLMQHTDTVVASAGSVRDFYIDQIGADPDKVVVIYNAVDWSQLETTMNRAELRANVGVPVDAPAAGIIARLTEQKAHRVLLDAMASRSELSALHVIVVGDGELRADLQGRAERLGLAGRVHFVGARRDLGNILGAIDMFLMPSLWEGLPLSLVLAMGAGLPVIASRVAGIPEVVQDQVSGLLVDPGNTSQLADAMVRLVQNDGLRRRLSEEAQAFVRPRFGVDGYIASITALYDRLLTAKRVSAFANATADRA